jgi:opacity protein-like surface antigen
MNEIGNNEAVLKNRAYTWFLVGRWVADEGQVNRFNFQLNGLNMKKFLVLFTALFAITATQARADLCCNDGSTYGYFFGGVNWLDVTSCRANASFDTGYLVGGAVGYRACENVRFEAELAYRSNDIKSGHFRNLNIDGGSSSSSSEFNRFKLKGHLNTFSVLANALYDWSFDCGCNQTKVYIGGGIGYANQEFKAHLHQRGSSSSSSSSEENNIPRRCHNTKNKNGFAAQFIVGLAYNICENYDATIEYRYFSVNTTNKNENNDLVFGIKAGF